MFFKLWHLVLFLLFSCSTNGPVSTQINLDFWKQREREAPVEFQSPNIALQNILQDSPNLKNKKEIELLRAGIIKSLLKQEKSLINEFQLTNQIILTPGQSYDFELKSFCVHAGAPRPLEGDGSYPAPLEGSPKDWLPQILEKYSQLGISQQKAQTLIWGLLSGQRFNELSAENRANLLKIFPDAMLRFGNSQIESFSKQKAQKLIEEIIPPTVNSAYENFNRLKESFLEHQNSYKKLESIFAPENQRTQVLPSKWLETPEGYFIKINHNSYSSVSIKIYAPQNLKPGIAFKPSQTIVTPAQGQRLALSPAMKTNTTSAQADKILKYILDKFGISVNESEIEVIKKYPLDAIQVYLSMKKAFALTKTNFPGDPAKDNKADAFRHFVWSGLTTHEIGAEKAREFLEAHENSTYQSNESKNMDLYNNAQGIKAAQELNNSDSFENSLVQEARVAINEGRLRVLR